MEKFAEDCKVSEKFGISIKINFWTKDISNGVKKSCVVLKLCHFKVQCLDDVPMEIVR